jgi:hypothetical protein
MSFIEHGLTCPVLNWTNEKKGTGLSLDFQYFTRCQSKKLFEHAYTGTPPK